MDIITIVQALLRWGIPALLGGILVFAALVCVNRVYRTLSHGKRGMTRGQTVCLGLLCCWLLLVVGLTTLSRGPNFNGSFNLNFLSGYLSAWNNWSVGELQLILFNMLMFAPLGFLLPLLWKRGESLWVTVLVSLAVTGSIEGFQLLTGTGIFELDDLFHNVLGTVFGYFCVMVPLTALREKRIPIGAIGRALLLPGGIGLILAAAFLVYSLQPYGNMSILPAAPQDLSEVQVVAEWEPSQEEGAVSLYKNEYAEDRTYVQKIQSALAQLEQLTFSKVTRREEENWGYTGTTAEGTAFQMYFFFRTGEWSYTTFQESAASLTEEAARQARSRYETWMKDLDLLPEDAVFSLQNGNTLRWDVAPKGAIATGQEDFQKGSVLIQLDERGKLSSFYYQISWNAYAATEPICSEQEAFAQVQQGKFDQYVPFQPGDKLYVTGSELDYVYDTKGFYQPVYVFQGYLNEKENTWTARIPARLA